MARMAVQAGTRTIIVTPHQLGNFRQNTGPLIREWTQQLAQFLQSQQINLEVLPGGDVRIENDMIQGLVDGSVMTLGDHRRHVLLELPHELYFPLEPILDQLEQHQIQGILSHPERNVGLLARPQLLAPLVDRGCLMQVTCGSLMGTFGAASQHLAQFMLNEGLVHFLASDGHSPRRRRPVMNLAFEAASKLVGHSVAMEICSTNPRRVAAGQYVQPGRVQVAADQSQPRNNDAESKSGLSGTRKGWFQRRAA